MTRFNLLLLLGVLAFSANALTPEEIANEIATGNLSPDQLAQIIRASQSRYDQQVSQDEVDQPIVKSSEGSVHVRLPRDGDMRVQRSVTVDVGDTLQQLQTDIKVLRESARADAANAAYNATLRAMESLNERMDSYQKDSQSTLVKVETLVNVEIGSMKSTMSEQISSMSKTVSTVSTQIGQQLTESISAITASSSKAAVQLNLEVDTKIKAVGNNLTVVSNGIKEVSKVYMWTGGCTVNGYGGGWREYCVNKMDGSFPMVQQPKFKIDTNYRWNGQHTRFVALETAFFWITFATDGSASGWHYNQILVQGKSRIGLSHRQHYHESGSTWRGQELSLVYRIEKGQQFWARGYCGSWYSYRDYPSNDNDPWSRITVVYQGPSN